MLFAEINAEVEKYKEKAFTGHLKFGIEKSQIVSMTENSRCEKSDCDNADFGRQLMRLCEDSFYGSIEFDFILGEVKRLNYCKSYNGEYLKSKLGKAQMQKCLKCGKDIKYIATGPGKSIACDSERLAFVTDNGRQFFGYLIHVCENKETENAEEKSRT